MEYIFQMQRQTRREKVGWRGLLPLHALDVCLQVLDAHEAIGGIVYQQGE